MTFLELAQRVLNETKKPMSQSEIWKYSVEKGYDKILDSNGKTPWDTLAAQLYVNVRDHKILRLQPMGVDLNGFI